MIRGLYETFVYVTDFQRSRHFYEDLLGLSVGWLSEERRIVLYSAGPAGSSMLGIVERAPEKVTPQHFSFTIALDDMKDAVSFLERRGIRGHNLIDQGPSPQVHGWMPAVSLYFEDPDGHLLEFVAMLPDKPRPEIGRYYGKTGIELSRRHATSPGD
jgi:lactoylglutathione lyase